MLPADEYERIYLTSGRAAADAEFDRQYRREEMKMWRVVLFLALCLGLVALFSGCAYQPIVDTKGVDGVRYETDLRECQEYAQQVAGPGTGAAVGVVAGYALGYVLGRTAGVRNPSSVARPGAVVGGVSGAGAGAQSERQVVSRCLQGRGYNVLH